MDKKMISLEIPTELYEAIRRKAFIENASISKFIRELLTVSVSKEIASVKEETAYGLKK